MLTSSIDCCTDHQCRWKEYSQILLVRYEEMKRDFENLITEVSKSKITAPFEIPTVYQHKLNILNEENKSLQQINVLLRNKLSEYENKPKDNNEDVIYYTELERSVNTDFRLEMLSQTVRSIREKLRASYTQIKEIQQTESINIIYNTNNSPYKKIAEDNYQHSMNLAEQLIGVRTDLPIINPNTTQLDSFLNSPKKQKLPPQIPYVSTYHGNTETMKGLKGKYK